MDRLPDDMAHFAVASRFATSPREVLEEWDEEMLLDALELMQAEWRYRQRHKPKGGGR